MSKVRGVYLRCCICDNGTRGRQWWNRDHGFGLCDECIDFAGVSSIPVGGVANSYGVRGVHWDINNSTPLPDRVLETKES